MDWTHPATLEYFAVDAQWAAGKRNLNGACVAFHPHSLQALKLAKQWRDGALIKECIAPEGSSRKNHRQDQALLTVLAYKHGLADATESQYLGFETHRDIDEDWRERRHELERRYHAAKARRVQLAQRGDPTRTSARGGANWRRQHLVPLAQAAPSGRRSR